MPYISAEARPDYDALITEAIFGSKPENWEQRIAALVFCVARELYGDARNTRYFKQNELLGVFFAAALECTRRIGGTLPEAGKIDGWEQAVAEMQPLARRALALIPAADETQRCGHLNYFVTELTLGAVNQGWIGGDDNPGGFLADLGATWYAYATGPYEDGAIEKSGDTPGYLRMLG